MNALPRVSVIIVSFEVRELLRCCLDSLGAQEGVQVETWVVENASRDGSADMVAGGYPAAHLVRNASNVGFATANNQALRQATGDWLLLLNPDTELPAGALAGLAQVFGRHPRAGAVGLALRNPDGSPQASCFAFHLLVFTPGCPIGKNMHGFFNRPARHCHRRRSKRH